MDCPGKTFYNHVDYAASYYAIYTALEDWFSRAIFREDSSRMIFASNDYAFRRRFELTDASEDYTKIQASSLAFPFANYWPGNRGWEPDDRPAANPWSLVREGLSANTRNLRAIAVKTTIPMTFYFDRDDDARFAYENLLHFAYLEQRPYTAVSWKGETIGIPLYFKIQDLSYNPEFKENNWLKENRIFIISAEIELRSYSILPPLQSPYSQEDTLVEDEKFSITEEVILQMISNGKILHEEQVSSLFDLNKGLIVNSFFLAASTATTARLQWDIPETSKIASLKITLSGKDPIVIDPLSKDYTFRRLKENSSYVATLEVQDKDGHSKLIFTKFTTPLSAASARKAEAAPNSLVGITW